MLEGYGHMLLIIRNKHCAKWKGPLMTNYSGLKQQQKNELKQEWRQP
jgi:hypothetical protein